MTIDLLTERVNRGLSAEAFAREIGVKPHVLRYVENTGGRPRGDSAVKIASFFGLKVTDVWPIEERAA